MWKILEGTPAKPFEYYIDGEKQEGVWLGGYDNTTLWGFKYYPASLGTYDKDYYYMRLLGPDSADPTSGEKLKANETREYLRIGF